MVSRSSRSGLFLRTFGGAALEDAHGRVLKVQRKQLAVLVLMRVPREQLSRARLEQMLWLNVSGDASNSLSQALGALREWFPDLPRGKGPFEWPGRDALACDVDVLLAGDLGAETRRAALEVYRGPFLKAFNRSKRPEQGEAEFRHWVDQRQEEYEAEFRRLVVAESDAAIAAECWERVEAVARQAIDVDRHWPRAHALLLRALACGGHADQARRHYDAVLKQLMDDGEPGEAVEVDPEIAEAWGRVPEWAELARRRAASPSASREAEEAADGPAPAAPERARAPGTPLPPASRRSGWHRGAGAALAAAAVVVALVTYAVHGRIPASRKEPGERGGVALAPLCEPGTLRAVLVEQDFKADPVNVVPPNTHFTTVWHLQNTGRCTWPASLRLHRVGPKPLSISDRDVPAQRAVAPGDTIQFPSAMVAPGDTGRFGETWELLDAGGRRVPVGEGRGTLAAAIRVLDGPPPACRPADVRAEVVTRGYTDGARIRPGARFVYEWTFMNRAQGCTLDDGYALRFVSASPERMSSPSVAQLPITQPVIPSQGYTFEIPMRAPARPGTYAESWSLVYRDGRVVPVQGFATTGVRLEVRDDTAAVPEVPFCRRGEYSIAFMKAEQPLDGTEIPAGGEFVKKWTVANRGRCTWETGLRLHFVRARGGRRASPPFDVYLDRPVAPRESYTFHIPVRVPRRSGPYAEYWSAIDPAGDTVQISLTKVIWTEVMVMPPRE